MKPDLDELYASFGPVVRAEVESQLRDHGSLACLLRRLSLSVPNRIDMQHDVLRSFIFQYGIAFFLRCLRSTHKPQDVERLKLLRLVQGSPYQHGATAVRDGGSAAGRDGVASAGSCARISPGPGVGDQEVPPYCGPDRRVRQRRGSVPTRRARVDAVSRNRRFGGRERRKADRRQG